MGIILRKVQCFAKFQLNDHDSIIAVMFTSSHCGNWNQQEGFVPLMCNENETLLCG